MLSIFVNQKGVLSRAEWKAGEPLPENAIWVDLMAPTAEEEAAVEKVLHIDIPVREKLAEIESSSRTYTQDGARFMTATLTIRAENDKPESDAVTFILSGKLLITVRYCEPRSIAMLLNRCQRPNSCPTTGEALLVQLLEAIVDRAADHLERVGTIVTKTSLDVFEKSVPRLRQTRHYQRLLRQIGAEGDCASNVRESLVSLARLTAFLSVTSERLKSDPELKQSRAQIKTLQRDIQSLNDHATFLSGKIAFLLDAVLGMISIDQNDIIKIFSIAAVVLLPPTLIASIYGMNFRVMPELDWQYGYPFALGLMVVSVVVTFVYFRRKGWL